jgi:deoxyribonuclease V
VDVPVVGVGKTLLCGTHPPAGRKRGDWRPLELDDERVGVVLTTKDDTSPIYVSVGHRVGLFPAARLVLKTCTRFRLPEPIRHADAASRRLARSGGLASVG